MIDPRELHQSTTRQATGFRMGSDGLIEIWERNHQGKWGLACALSRSSYPSTAVQMEALEWAQGR